jgi:threonine dehydrogenase-like Zn-dependent dehydrogenase
MSRALGHVPAGAMAEERWMKILQVTSPREYELHDTPVSEPGPGQVLLRIEAVTTCPQWDLHLRHNDPMFVGHQFHYPYTPGQPGHEATGRIEAVGEGVTGLALGDRVCAWRDAGQHVPGCYAQYVVHLQESVIRVPEGPAPEALAPLELAMCVGTVFRMLRDMQAVSGRTVGVGGLGPAGLVALQMAKAEGAAAVVGFDPLGARRELAAKLGCDVCSDPGGDAPPLETSVDCVGAKASVEALMDRTSDVVALFGVQREDYTFAPRHYSLRLCGYKGHSRESAEYALGLIEAGKLDLASLVTHKMPLECYGEAIDLLERREAVKVCFFPWES